MRIDIKATNLELTPSISAYINEKVGSLEKFINVSEDFKSGESAPVEAFVEIARTTKHHKHGDVYRAEINLKIKGELLRAEHSDWDMRVALDAAKDLMERQLTEGKSKKQTVDKKGARLMKRLMSISPMAWFTKEK
ncbi:ribosome-associated translation inhibitor RaiA [Candidatus Azambacteria bacterium]|nr:ribosome-associated translation inhibitor RaiA [Candidatus Azambacteria bacterium]